MTDLPRDFSHLSARPEKPERLFQSDAIEQVIEEVSAKIHDPIIRRMFRQCYPNTLDTTTYYREDADGTPDTVVVTGDIPAMWSRDSWAQFKPYLPYVNRDEKLQKAFAGLVVRHKRNILTDPYANAYVDPYVDNPPKTPHWEHGDGWHPGVWERKYELDSLGAFFSLSHSYYEKTRDARPYDDEWIEAAVTALDVVRAEQYPLNKDTLHIKHKALQPNGEPFPAVQNRGWGHPHPDTGMSRTLFRPSDDESLMPFLVPANAMAVVSMTGMARVLRQMREPQLSREFFATANEIHQGIQKHGIVEHEKYGRMFAYEVDGNGGRIMMDDPNVPSLLSLPQLGYVYAEAPVWQNTKRFITSNDDPYWVSGKKAEGLSSPHVGEFDMRWPIETMMRIMTSNNDDEIRECLLILRDTSFGTYFQHEAVNVDDSGDYTRPWFGWANSLFGEMVIYLVQNKPHILANELRVSV